MKKSIIALFLSVFLCLFGITALSESQTVSMPPEEPEITVENTDNTTNSEVTAPASSEPEKTQPSVSEPEREVPESRTEKTVQQETAPAEQKTPPASEPEKPEKETDIPREEPSSSHDTAASGNENKEGSADGNPGTASEETPPPEAVPDSSPEENQGISLETGNTDAEEKDKALPEPDGENPPEETVAPEGEQSVPEGESEGKTEEEAPEDDLTGEPVEAAKETTTSEEETAKSYRLNVWITNSKTAWKAGDVVSFQAETEDSAEIAWQLDGRTVQAAQLDITLTDKNQGKRISVTAVFEDGTRVEAEVRIPEISGNAPKIQDQDISIPPSGETAEKTESLDTPEESGLQSDAVPEDTTESQQEESPVDPDAEKDPSASAIAEEEAGAVSSDAEPLQKEEQETAEAPSEIREVTLEERSMELASDRKLFAGNSNQDECIAVLSAGTQVKILDAGETWLLVSIGDQEGFLVLEEKEPVPEEPAEEAASEERSVQISMNRGSRMRAGETVTISAEISGFTASNITYVWLCDQGSCFTAVAETQTPSYSFTASKDSLGWAWQVKVIEN